MADKKELEVVEKDVIEVEAKVVEEEKSTEIAEVKETAVSTFNSPFESLQAFKEMGTIAAKLASSTMIPEAYQGNPSNCLIALEQANRMNCSPLLVMQQLYVVKGKPTWSGQACSMIVNGCGLFDSVDLCYVGKEGTDEYGAYVKAIRKSDGAEIKGTTVTMKMAKAEGWTKNPKWISMTTQMLGYRAYSFFARLYCPNALSGFATEGEVEDSEKRQHRPVDSPFE